MRASIRAGFTSTAAPFAHTERVLRSDCSSTACRIHVPQQDFVGIATRLDSGRNSVQLCSRTRTGMVDAYATEGGEINAILGGA